MRLCRPTTVTGDPTFYDAREGIVEAAENNPSWSSYVSTINSIFDNRNILSTNTDPGEVPVPSTPTNFVGTTTSQTSIDLTWNIVSYTEDGFIVEKKKSTESTYVQIDDMGPGSNTCAVSGLEANTTYNFRVKAYNASGSSSYRYETCGTYPLITAATITGPDPVTPGIKNFYSASVTSGGSGNYSYTWYKRDSASGNDYYWYDGFQDTDVTPGPTTFAWRVDIEDNLTNQLFQVWKGIGGAVPKVVANLPQEFSIGQNYPNPFNPQTTIQYSLPEEGQVRLVVYNLLGQEIRTLVNTLQPAGYYEVVWDGRNSKGQPVSSGVYLYRLTAGAYSEGKRMTLIK